MKAFQLNFIHWEVQEVEVVELDEDRVRLPNGLIAHYGQTVFKTHNEATDQLIEDIQDKIDFFNDRLKTLVLPE